MKFETRVIHVGEEPNLKEGGFGDVVVPIHLSSTFARRKVDEPTQGYEYSRSQNPTRFALEKRLASLEDAQFALAFSSGMAAEMSLIMGLLKNNDHIVAFNDLYGGSRRLFDKVFSENFRIQTTYVDARDPSEIEKAYLNNTKMIWLESPTNPTLKLCDISAISEFARKKSIIVVVDNTFLSPYFQKPLKLGAHVVLHSTTKYINGHSDSVGGSIMLNDEELFKKLKFVQNAMGAILSPFDAYMVLRGIKTLAIRMKQHEENALIISEYLSKHKKVLKVYYPGLKSHSQYNLALDQMSGFGGMISFELNTDINGAKKFVESLKYFLLAESLGGVESLIEIPSLMTHSSISAEDRKNIGISDSLIRISVGIEHIDDLLRDLDSAFAFI